MAIFLFKISSELGISKFLELGPGNGTLMSDIIRTLSKLSKKEFLFSLYEKSSFLKKIQLERKKQHNNPGERKR